MSLQPIGVMRRRRRVLAVEVARLQDALQRLSAPRPADDITERLPGLLRAVWQAYGSSAWVVGDLRDHGLVRADQTAVLGHLLSRVAADGLPVAGLHVERLTESRAGRVWMLRRVARPAGIACHD